jgi:mannose-1-phosphate guanylyltransferase
MDLGAAVAAHRASGALATLVLRARGWEQFFPLEHDGSGRLLTVPSLPGKGDGAHPDLAAARAAGTVQRALFTGVHIVEPAVLDALPAEGCILRQGYAPLLARGAHLGAFVVPDESFFSDLGTPQSYLACSRALLARGGGGPLVDPSAHVEGAVLDAHTVVGAGARVARGVSLAGCVVWPGTEVTEDTSDAILAPGISLGAT